MYARWSISRRPWSVPPSQYLPSPTPSRLSHHPEAMTRCITSGSQQPAPLHMPTRPACRASLRLSCTQNKRRRRARTFPNCEIHPVALWWPFGPIHSAPPTHNTVWFLSDRDSSHPIPCRRAMLPLAIPSCPVPSHSVHPIPSHPIPIPSCQGTARVL